MMEDFLPDGCSSDGIRFDRRKGLEWLKEVFQRHVNILESDLLETDQFSFGPPPMPPFFHLRPVEDKLGENNRF